MAETWGFLSYICYISNWLANGFFILNKNVTEIYRIKCFLAQINNHFHSKKKKKQQTVQVNSNLNKHHNPVITTNPAFVLDLTKHLQRHNTREQSCLCHQQRGAPVLALWSVSGSRVKSKPFIVQLRNNHHNFASGSKWALAIKGEAIFLLLPNSTILWQWWWKFELF